MAGEWDFLICSRSEQFWCERGFNVVGTAWRPRHCSRSRPDAPRLGSAADIHDDGHRVPRPPPAPRREDCPTHWLPTWCHWGRTVVPKRLSSRFTGSFHSPSSYSLEVGCYKYPKSVKPLLRGFAFLVFPINWQNILRMHLQIFFFLYNLTHFLCFSAVK